MPLPKHCSRCGKRFQPTGRHCKLCDECHRKAQLETKHDWGYKRKIK